MKTQIFHHAKYIFKKILKKEKTTKIFQDTISL
jgi:hypothetical protein